MDEADQSAAWVPALLQVSDPLFPTGAYAHSMGLEQWAATCGYTSGDDLIKFFQQHAGPALARLELPYLRLVRNAEGQTRLILHRQVLKLNCPCLGCRTSSTYIYWFRLIETVFVMSCDSTRGIRLIDTIFMTSCDTHARVEIVLHIHQDLACRWSAHRQFALAHRTEPGIPKSSSFRSPRRCQRRRLLR